MAERLDELMIAERLRCLNEGERQVILYRMGRDVGRLRTREEVAEKFGFTVKRIAVIENKFLGRCRFHRWKSDEDQQNETE